MALSTTNGVRPGVLAKQRTREEIADDQVQQLAPEGDVPGLHVLAPGFVRAVHPDHGQAVTYTPGEALPSWLASAYLSGHLTVGPDGVLYAKGARDGEA